MRSSLGSVCSIASSCTAAACAAERPHIGVSSAWTLSSMSAVASGGVMHRTIWTIAGNLCDQTRKRHQSAIRLRRAGQMGHHTHHDPPDENAKACRSLPRAGPVREYSALGGPEDAARMSQLV